MKIGLFDSGIGGLNVLKEFIKKYPNNTYYYYGDTKNIPYGDKDKETLLNLSFKIISFFENIKVDLIIIACGTISSNCYKELKKRTSIPIYDIISPVINYLNKNNFLNILILGTKRTIESHLFKENIKTNIHELATPEFVPMIEESKIDSLIIKNYLLKYKNIDCLVLGCTHYPLLIPEFKKYLTKNIKIIDMGKILVNDLNLSNNSKLEINLYFTKLDNNIKNNISNIIKNKYNLYEFKFN